MENKRRSGRNGKIELMRFICAVIVMQYHFSIMDEKFFFLSGSLAVEFFFALSGYLMMASIDRLKAPGKETGLGGETVRFLARKVRSVYPEVLIGYLVAFAVRCIAENKSVSGVLGLALDSVWEVVLMRQVGLQLRGVNSVTWYISAMLIVMAVYYPLLRRYKEMMTRLVMPVASLLILGWICQNYATPGAPSKWIGWMFKGTARAFGEIGMGVVCYQLSKGLGKLRLTTVGRVSVTCLEPLLYGTYIAFMFFLPATKRAWVLVPLLAVAIGVTFSGQTLTHRLLDGPFTIWLGKISLPLYLGHFCWANYLPNFLPEGTAWGTKFGVYLAVSAATTLVIYLTSALIRRWQIVAKVKRLFVAGA